MDGEKPHLEYFIYKVAITLQRPLGVVITPEYLAEAHVALNEWLTLSDTELPGEIREIRYDNGLVVTTDPTSPVFEMAIALSSDILTTIDQCNWAVDRFIWYAHRIDVEVVESTVQLYGLTMMPEGSPGVRDLGPIKEGVLPIVTVRTEYGLRDRYVQLDVVEMARDDGTIINCLEFSYRVTFPSEFYPAVPYSTVWSLIQRQSQEWVDDSNSLVSFFYQNYVALE